MLRNFLFCLYILFGSGAVSSVLSAEPAAENNGIDIVVGGSCGGRGSEAAGSGKCFYAQTLLEAIGLAKSIRSDRDYPKTVPVTIRLGSGIYRLEKPIHLEGAEASNLRIIGQDDRSAVISGSVAVSGFRDTALDPQNEIYVSGIKEAYFDASKYGVDYSYQGTGFGRRALPVPLMVLFNDQLMVLARYPDSGYMKIDSATKAATANSYELVARLDKPYPYLEKSDIVACGYFSRDWAYECIPASAAASTSEDKNFVISGAMFGAKPGQRVFFQNALSFLSSPGEWFYSLSAKKIYFKPPVADASLAVEVAVATSLLELTSSKNTEIRGVTFQNVRGDAITIRGGSDVRIENATIRNVGNRAAFVTGLRSGLSNVLIENSGDGGVLLSGGNRQTLSAADLYVENCEIRNYAWNSKTYRAAVTLMGVGNRVKACRLHDAAHSAIMFSGNNHLILGNEIYRTNKETDDSGAIYAGRSWSSLGTIISGNYFHDIKGDGNGKTMGIYLDDQFGFAEIKNNLFVDVEQPVFIGGGRANAVVNNVFLRSSPSVHIDGRGLSWQKNVVLDKNSQLNKSLAEVPWQSDLYLSSYPKLAGILSDEPGAPKNNVVDGNVFIDSEKYRWMDGSDKYVELGKIRSLGEMGCASELKSDADYRNCHRALMKNSSSQ